MEQQWLVPKLVASKLLKPTATNTEKSFTLKSVVRAVKMVILVVLPLTLHSLASLVQKVVAFLAVALRKNLSNYRFVVY